MNDTTETKPQILIVDDESSIRDLLAQMLADEYHCVTSESAEAAILECEARKFELVISDINLGGMTGVEMVPRIKSLSPDTVVMMISGANSVDTAIDAMRVGVFDYLPKPFDFDQVIVAVRRALTHHRTLVAKRVHEVELARLVEQKTAELQHIAHHDKLTDLPNEIMFGDRLSELLAGYDVSGRAAVLLISVSNLRAVRDSIGKAAADKILFEVARRLRALGKDGMVARFEGDKFALAIADADSNRVVEANRQIFA